MNAASVWDSLLTHYCWKYQNLRSLCVKFTKFGMALHYEALWKEDLQLGPNKQRKVETHGIYYEKEVKLSLKAKILYFLSVCVFPPEPQLY